MDLRFSDSKLEHLYCNYYAQVKRNLLPTAIQVVLLVNILQLLATCLQFYLIANEAPHSGSGSIVSSIGTTAPPSNPEDSSSADTELASSVSSSAAAKALFLPLILQVTILCISFLMLRRVRAELDAKRTDKLATGEESSSTDSGNESNQEEGVASDTEEADEDGAASEMVALKGLSSSDSKRKSSATTEQEDQHPSASNRLSKQSSQLGGRLSKHLTGKTVKRASTLSNQTSLAKLSRFKLSLPYILWLCQLVQLACGLWPQLSFISYSILLLYSYTIYVIVPIRLTNCLILALLLSLSQPLVDYLILINLKSQYQPSNLPHQHHHQPNHQQQQQQQQHQQHHQEQQQELQHFNGHMEERHLLQGSKNYLLLIGDMNSLNSASVRHIRGTNIGASIDSFVGGNELENSLLIPMTSHPPKLLAFMLLTLGINLIGIMSFLFYERQQRAAFLETRQSLETKLTLEQESQEQVSQVKGAKLELGENQIISLTS